MLKTLDILIGLTVILLALSMAVTVITQTIITILNSRGLHLRRGLVDLLQQLDPALNAELSKAVATTILKHPLVSGSTPSITGLLGGPRLGNVVHREEFTKLLMALAGDQGSTSLQGAAKDALVKALSANGVDNPAQALKNIRQLALQLERSSPELSNIARQNLAILHAAESDLVAKINNWYDQTMDRTSQRFTASTRAITFVGAFIIAFGLQVDTPTIVNRLSADDQLRQQLVQDAQTLYAERERQQAQAAEAVGAPASPPTDVEMELAKKQRAMLSAAGLIRLPSSGGAWLNGFDPGSMLGMLLTALLLSLGAPFWYGMLGQLLQLRSVLARKDDQQRAERQTTTESTSASAAGTGALAPQSTAAAILAGERGDLGAIG